MTVSSQTYKNTYAGDNSQTVFAYVFKVLDQDHLEVVLVNETTGARTVQTITTHYTVSGVGEDVGGNVTFLTAPTTNQTVVITRTMPLLQETEYRENDPFPANTHERALDYLTMAIQSLKDEVDRAVKVPNNNVVTDGDIPDTDMIADYIFRVNSDGDGVEAVQFGEAVQMVDMTRDLNPDGSLDYVLTWDDSAGAAKKVLIDDLVAAASGGVSTASNVGVGGVGVFKQKNGLDLEFRNINAGSSKITVTNDSGNNEIDIDVAQANIDHGSIGGLTDDDHTQYVLGVGRSGGQSITGGTGSGDDLTLNTTSNITKGSYILAELTSNGFVKTSGGTGTLSVDTTSYQTLDAELTALAGLTSAADKVPYFTGSGTAALADFSSYGRSLVDDADASAARTTLGLGTIATQNSNSVSISGGTITGITDLAVADGGTGASNASDARTNLGLVIGTDVQAYDAELAAIAGLTSAADKGIQFTGAGTAATYDLTTAGKALLDDADASAQRTTLGLVIGTNVQAYDTELAAIAGLTSAADKGIQFTGAGTAATYDLTAAGKALLDDVDASAQRTTLGLGTVATQNANSVSISGGSITGITDLAVADGGTGASNAADARTNLGLVIGTNVQAYDADLAAIAGLTSAADKGIQFTGAGTAGTYDLTAAGKALLDDADASAQRTTLGLVIGTNVQAYDAELAALAGLTSAADKLPYFTGSGTAAVADFSAFGRTLVDDADASAARTTLGLVIGTNVQAYDADLAVIAGLVDPNADRILFWDDSAGAYDYLTIGSNLSITGTTLNATGGGGGLSDGDYGDITVSASATVLTIDNDVVTYAKMQNVSATDMLLGRSTAGAGDVEEIACTAAGRALLDDADASAQRTTLGLVIGTNVQAYDAELAALAGLTSAADKLPYFTGAGTAGVADFSAFGRTLVDDADASTARTTLGLVIGTNVQAYDAELAALAGLTSAADKGIQFTGSGTAATYDLTAAGKALLDDADAAAQRTTLGLVIGTNVQAYDADLTTIAGLADPNADRILFWDDSAGAYAYLEVGSGLSLSGTTITATGGAGSFDYGLAYQMRANINI